MHRFISLFISLLTISGFAYSQTNQTGHPEAQKGFPSISAADLRTSKSGTASPSYYIADPGQEGMFYYDKQGGSDTSNGGSFAGTTIRTADGKVFRRAAQGALQLSWFGGVPDNPARASQNVEALNRAVKTAKSEQLVVAAGGGTWYFNRTISLRSTYSKRINVKIEGNVTFTAPVDGFLLEHFFPLRLEITGILTGPNSGGGSTEKSWAKYTGTGIYMKNLYNSFIKVSEVREWRVGIEMTGEANGGVGTTALGSQYNEVHSNWVHHNYIQIKLSTKGAAGTHGNWCNESRWHIGQVGRGIPGKTYGQGGWIGLQIGSDPGSSQDVWYGISGHVFYDLNIEGVEKGILAWNSGHISFINFSMEPEGAREHIRLAEDSKQGGPASNYHFNSGTLVEDRYFVTGGRGLHTRINNLPLYGKLTNGAVVYIGEKSTVIPSTPVMRGHTVPAPGTLLISDDAPIGWSAFNALKDTTHSYWSKLAQFPEVQNGTIRIGGVQRSGAYKSSYLDVNASSGDTVNARPNLGYVRFHPTANKVVRIHAGDFAPSPDYEGFEVEYNSAAHTLTFVSGLTGAVAIPPSNFPVVGKYRCVYRSGSWVVWRTDGGSTSTSSNHITDRPDNSANAGTAQGKNENGFEVFSTTVTVSNRAVVLAALDNQIPENSAGEIEVILLGKSQTNPGRIYTEHTLDNYYRGRGKTVTVKGPQTVVKRYNADFVPFLGSTLTVGGKGTEGMYRIYVGTGPNDNAVTWTAYVKVRYTQTNL